MVLGEASQLLYHVVWPATGTAGDLTSLSCHPTSAQTLVMVFFDTCVVQQVIPLIATQLAHIFNRSFTTGIVPNKLKIAKVIPIYKNENPELFANYRPISIHPSISKILEPLMYNRLYNFLAEHNKKNYNI